MSYGQLLESGLLGSLFAAGLLASVPSFEPARRGWLPRFGWVLLRYLLPLLLFVVVVSWFLLPHAR